MAQELRCRIYDKNRVRAQNVQAFLERRCPDATMVGKNILGAQRVNVGRQQQLYGQAEHCSSRDVRSWCSTPSEHIGCGNNSGESSFARNFNNTTVRVVAYRTNLPAPPTRTAGALRRNYVRSKLKVLHTILYTRPSHRQGGGVWKYRLH